MPRPAPRPGRYRLLGRSSLESCWFSSSCGQDGSARAGRWGCCSWSARARRGHAILGVHRHLVWGLDAGLLLLLARHRGGPALTAVRAWLSTPRVPAGLLRVRTAVTWLGLLAVLRVVATFPLFASLALLVVLTLTWIRARQRPELRHA
ncbi:MAG: hypothetical protein R3F43_05750 [bacterium]